MSKSDIKRRAIMDPLDAAEYISKLEMALKDGRELVSHAIAMGHFTPNGSTEGWAKRWLASLRKVIKP